MFYKIILVNLSLFIGLNFYAKENSFKGINQMNKKSGIFLTQDILGNSIILHWEEISGKTEKLNEKIKSLSEILVSSYTKTEVEFARNKPEDIPSDFMLKSLASLLEQGTNKIDWKIFEEKTKNILEQFFMTMDFTKHSGSQDINILGLA